MTLKNLMQNDVYDVFLNKDDFAQDIIRYPKSDAASPETITAVVVGDNLEGTREVPGDGRVFHTEETVRVRESVTLEIDANIQINEMNAFNHEFDQFKIDGEIYNAKRVTGRDGDMQSVLCVLAREKMGRKSRLRG